VYLPDVGTQVFLCFEDDEEVQMERLADVGIEKEEEDEEERNYLRKERSVLCELQGICTVACERDLHVGAPLMSIRHLIHCNLFP
jgi:hypothetical protein